MQNTVAPKSLADAIRKFVFDAYVVPARAEGHDEVVLRAGDVHRDMRLESRMPAVCSAIGPKFEAEYGVKVLDRAGPAQGANVYFRLLVRPAAPHPRIAAITQVAGSVSSPQRDAAARLPTPDPSATGSAIWLVSCVSEKRTDAAMAKDLYISDWFTKARRFVERSNAHWFILSAKHGLLRPDEIIPPYEQTLTDMSVEDRRAWGRLVLGQFTRTMPGAREVAILAGMRYREFLVEPLRQQGVKVRIPMEGLRIGEQLSWLAAN